MAARLNKNGLTKAQQKEVNKCAKAAIKYLRSKKGQAGLAAAMKRAQETTDRLREVQKVPWWRMLEPMTV